MSMPPQLGPIHVRTDRPRHAAMRVLKVLSEEDTPLTIIALTAKLGGHPNSIRLQLESLVQSGFVTEETVNTGGRGRPARVYEATTAGHQVAGQDAHREDDAALIAAIADQLATTSAPAEAAHALGRAWGQRLAADERGLMGPLLARDSPRDRCLRASNCGPAPCWTPPENHQRSSARFTKDW